MGFDYVFLINLVDFPAFVVNTVRPLIADFSHREKKVNGTELQQTIPECSSENCRTLSLQSRFCLVHAAFFTLKFSFPALYIFYIQSTFVSF